MDIFEWPSFGLFMAIANRGREPSVVCRSVEPRPSIDGFEQSYPHSTHLHESLRIVGCSPTSHGERFLAIRLTLFEKISAWQTGMNRR